nr:hypothetical protein [Rosistilla oblonga]
MRSAKIREATERDHPKLVDDTGNGGSAQIIGDNGARKIAFLDVSADGHRRTNGFPYPLEAATPLLSRIAWNAYQLGQYEESIELCHELNRRGAMPLWLYESVHLASAGLAKPVSLLISEACWSKGRDQVERIESLYPVEALWFQLNNSHLTAVDKIERIEEVFQRIAENLWMVPAAHPTAALLVAKWLLDHTDREDLARKLVCCCLGWKYVYRRVDDLISLAKLLRRLAAPKLFWTRIANIYHDFMELDNCCQSAWKRQNKSIFDEQLLTSYCQLVDNKEGVLHRFCADNGFPERDVVTELLIDSFGLKDYRNDEANIFPGRSGYVAGATEPWLSLEHFQMRHPWFCLLAARERDFIRNGDTGFVTCITDDYSMACSQWWRAIESILRRKLVDPLGALIDENPDWVDADRKYVQTLSPRKKERLKLFVLKLADPDSRRRMTLNDMLLLIEKCMADIRRKIVSASSIRRHAVQHVSERLSEFRWIKSEPDNYADMRSAFSQNVLSERSIQLFRNAASHDKPMDYEHAVAGRLLAIRILDFMHYPRYCVHEKLEELKSELRESEEKPKP